MVPACRAERVTRHACHGPRNLRLLAVKTLDEARLPTPPERGSQVVDLGFGLLDKLLIIAVCRRVALSSEHRVVVAVRVRAVSASPDSPSFPARTGTPFPATGSALRHRGVRHTRVGRRS